ncbi:GATA transcription factor 4 [Ziziphus jujuba]|uniref:GATA transcription factor n=2 Tax=Ziziphus jujuba TaxID=326968 RepID=A0A6P4ATL7_ZIZJJ|nr:GATA transcription factor 4 [Ziziphus jujuba]KAH7519645.1 hypothetical protein FEM48_Zijuj08G0059000 [Ziziphus jujuba var. spinosa]
MDVYGLSATDCFRIDDLLDFSNDDIFSSSTTTTSSSTDSETNHYHHHPPQPQDPSILINNTAHLSSTDFTNDLCVPGDDVAELEWLSQFVDDSFSDFPMTGLAGAPNYMNEASFSGRARSKRSRAPTTSWASTPVEPESLIGTTTGKPKSKRDSSPSKAASETGGLRRCSHCASEKTPQWRTGPLGPKTLCNACGVRYKSGRLVPEYRPAASPTFVLTQHSNSHRKVMELRRKKEEMRQQHQQRRQGEAEEQEQFYAHPQHHGFQVY